ncbi:MAG: OsmC family protein [Verrucomicrobiota bacterium]|nr:OsmC family protein [Verrucomicrobiota bacterium]
MVKITVEYQGDLHCLATHGPSGKTLETDAPVDNQGRGESFSPTDLVATALGTCMATVMGIQARTLGVDIKGIQIVVEKEMSADRPRRIVRLPVLLRMPAGIPEKHRATFERAAATCPVHHSIDPAIDSPLHFIWPE